jgi:hypothetical protein
MEAAASVSCPQQDSHHRSTTSHPPLLLYRLPPYRFTFFIGQLFLTLLCALKWGTFLFFGGFVALMTLFVILCIPETKGVPIEELSEVIIHKHWLWSRVVAGAPLETVTEDEPGSSRDDLVAAKDQGLAKVV